MKLEIELKPRFDMTDETKELDISEEKSEEKLKEARILGYESFVLDRLMDLQEGKLGEGKEGEKKFAEIIARPLYARDLLIIRAGSRDKLTGLYNKSYFIEQVEKASKNGPFGVLLIDFDHFKGINDTFGHFAADEVLVQAGLVFNGSVRQIEGDQVRKPDVVARTGGDEYAILLRGVKEEKDLERVALKILADVQTREFSVRNNGVREIIPAKISIGAGLYTGGDLTNFLENVDKKALYGAKNQGRNRLVVYSPDVQ